MKLHTLKFTSNELKSIIKVFELTDGEFVLYDSERKILEKIRGELE